MPDIKCESCSKRMRIPDRYAGKTVRCPDCEAHIIVPAQTAVPESVDWVCPRCEQTLQVQLKPHRWCHDCETRAAEESEDPEGDSVRRLMKKDILSSELIVECANPKCTRAFPEGFGKCPGCDTQVTPTAIAAARRKRKSKVLKFNESGEPVCHRCGGEKFHRVKPKELVAFTWDYICSTCNSRYPAPIPMWGKFLFIFFGVVLGGIGLLTISGPGSFLYSANSGPRSPGLGFLFGLLAGALGLACLQKGVKELRRKPE